MILYLRDLVGKSLIFAGLMVISSKVNTVSKWDTNNLKNIHLWIASLPLWDQLVTNQTCHFHRVYDDSFLPLDILSLQYLTTIDFVSLELIGFHSVLIIIPSTLRSISCTVVTIQQILFVISEMMVNDCV